MGHGYDHHSIQHHHIFHRKNMFLPIFCRLSIKDINLNNRRRKDPTPAADEPSSPKVSCMGQVKRNNRVTGFPAAVAAVAAVTTHHHKYSKLRKLFSSKALLPPISTSSQSTTNTGGAVVALSAAGGGRSRSMSCRSSRDQVCLNNLRMKLNSSSGGKCGQGFVKLVNIGELDPPLPVVKKAAPPGVDRDEVNLWKRRFSGAALKSLQIEPIHLPNTKSQPPTV